MYMGSFLVLLFDGSDEISVLWIGADGEDRLVVDFCFDASV